MTDAGKRKTERDAFDEVRKRVKPDDTEGQEALKDMERFVLVPMVLEGHNGFITSVAMSKDTIVSGSHDETVRMWNAKTGACEKTLKGHTKVVSAVAISSDGATIVSGLRDGTIRFWDMCTGAAQMRWKN